MYKNHASRHYFAIINDMDDKNRPYGVFWG